MDSRWAVYECVCGNVRRDARLADMELGMRTGLFFATERDPEM